MHMTKKLACQQSGEISKKPYLYKVIESSRKNVFSPFQFSALYIFSFQDTVLIKVSCMPIPHIGLARDEQVINK